MFWCVIAVAAVFFARIDLLSTTTLQYTQRGPSQRSGPPKLARGSLGDREIRVVRRGASQGSPRELGREPERLYLGPDPPSTLTANLH